MIQPSDNPLVSIITIVKNGEKHLQRTIQSVVNQTYSNIEYIVIDGESTDNTLQIIKDNAAHISYWVSERDSGISDAFNKGIAACSGDLIGIINADDWYEPDAIENIVKHFEEGAVFYGNNQYWKNDQKDYLFRANHQYLKREMTVNHPTVFIKKYVYDLHGKFDLNFKCAMDYELLLRFFLADVKFVYLDRTLVNMQLDGISDVHWKLGYQEVKKAKLKWLKTARWKIYFWYRKQIVTIQAIKTLQRLGLDRLVQIYRNYFSPIQKTK